MELGQYREEVAAWEDEYCGTQRRVAELQVLIEKDAAETAARLQLIGRAAKDAEDMGMATTGLKVSLQQLKAHADQDMLGVVGGPLDAEQGREVAQWRLERQRSREEVCACV